MKRKNIAKTAAFLAIFCLLFTGFWKLFEPKALSNIKLFHKLPKNSVDVLFVGSSHAYRGVDPTLLYEEEGLAGYVLGAPAQRLWNTYSYLVDALKTQTPRVVFVECYKAYNTTDFASGRGNIIKTLLGLRRGRNYVEAVQATVADPAEHIDYYLGFPLFHARYGDLRRADLYMGYDEKVNGIFLGYRPHNWHKPVAYPRDLAAIQERAELLPKVRDYLDRIVALTREKGIPLVFYIAPFAEQAQERQRYYNALEDYAREKGVPLLNYNLMPEELQLDDALDFADEHHLSMSGTDKLTRHLGEYIRAHYDLPDRRGAAGYETWERNARLMDQVRDGTFVQADDGEI